MNKKKRNFSRREFLQKTAAAGAVISLSPFGAIVLCTIAG